ncbi:CopG family ribbon-helix-helix protein [Amazonocrinis nigriterrae]|uniref:CopG family ribbon-helix-helix protein n=1 Tax=Amazonocrinis nigriterrae TaxID=2840443 RepID=UPI001CEDA02C|nr:CopG family ribbon-helix-helix protein [Amazonocrinis nigriterrae]
MTLSEETITFHLDSEKRKSLDEIALLLDRDRSYVLNEAINAYLEIYSWQLDHIKEGLRQADAGEFATPEEVAAAFAKWRK